MPYSNCYDARDYERFAGLDGPDEKLQHLREERIEREIKKAEEEAPHSTPKPNRNYTRKISINQAARIFRVIQGRHIRPGDLGKVTIEEAEAYIWAETFKRFIEINRLEVYEEVVPHG